jgi:hypothetical protein
MFNLSLSFPPPTDAKSLQRFLGMINFYRRFLPGIAQILKPLTDATSIKGRLSWTPEMTLSFQTAKYSLSSAIPLHFPNPSSPISLATDASNTHIGAVLQQKVKALGNLFPSFPKNFLQPKPVTPLSTGNC